MLRIDTVSGAWEKPSACLGRKLRLKIRNSLSKNPETVVLGFTYICKWLPLPAKVESDLLFVSIRFYMSFLWVKFPLFLIIKSGSVHLLNSPQAKYLKHMLY